jgi:hypothetical protein
MWHGAIQIVNVPVFHPLGSGGEIQFQQRPVFGFLDSHDQVRRLKVIFFDLEGIAVARRQGDSSVREPSDRLVVNGAVVFQIEPQSPGFGSPAQATGRCQCIEVELGEPAAVVIGGAEEEDGVHVLSAHRVILPEPGSEGA